MSHLFPWKQVDKAAKPINKLYDSDKLRALTTTFKRHTIERPIRPEGGSLNEGRNMSLQERLRKAGPTEYLRIYTRTVIPQIESRIEERLLA